MSYLDGRSFPRLEEVILIYESIGSGTEQDPHRLVLKVYSKYGQFLAEHDPYQKSF